MSARLVLVFAAAVLASASGAACAPTDACLRHSDCEGDQRCVDGRCFPGEGGAGGIGGAGGLPVGEGGSGGEGGAGG